MKILVVEDDRVTAHIYTNWLIKAGYEVKIATRGPEALAQVGLWGPDGVLLDVMLPDLNGIEALKRMRAEAPQLPVVVCTNAYNPTVVEQALAAGAMRIFDKSKLTALDLVAEFKGALSPGNRKRAA